jgi:F-type H+-transporting ATPase subunit b
MKHKALLLLLMLGLPLLGFSAQAEGHGAGIDWKSLAFQTINTLVFFAILYALLRKPAAEFFRSRLASIQSSLELAEKSRQEAKARLQEIEGKMVQLEEELAQIEQQAHRDAERERERIQEASRQESERIVQQARMEVEYRKRLAIQQLKEYALELGFSLAEKDIQAKLDDNTRQKLIEEFLLELGAKS